MKPLRLRDFAVGEGRDFVIAVIVSLIVMFMLAFAAMTLHGCGGLVSGPRHGGDAGAVDAPVKEMDDE